MYDDVAKELVKRAEATFARFLPWHSLNQELAWNFYPQRADFTTDLAWGAEFSDHLFDEGPVVMRRDLCNAFSSMLRPRGSRWFKPTTIDEDLIEEPGVKDWFEGVGNIMWRFLYEPRSGFVGATKMADHDFGTFGDAVLTVEPQMQRAGLLFRAHHLRDNAWVENADGDIDTNYRKLRTMTARQIRQKWPKAALHENIERALTKEPEHVFPVLHVMLPVDDFALVEGETAKIVKAARKVRQRFVSVYIDESHSQIIHIAGSHEFRYVIPRWQRVQGWPFAVSPATADTMPGARMLQAMARTGSEALEKSIDPPSMAVEEAIRGDINLFAGGTTWVDREFGERKDGTPALQLFDVGKNAILGLQAIEEHRMRLGNSMMISKLTLPQTNAKTAYETQQLVEEYIRAAVPLFEPIEEAYNAPLLDEAFNVLFRNGAFGSPEDMPEALRGNEFTWSFDNPLQQAKERVKVQQFQVMQGLLQLAAPVDQGVIADIDTRAAFRDAVRGGGAPESWIRDKAEADEVAAERAQAAAAMEAVNAAGMAGGAMGSVGDGLQKLGMAPV